MNRLRGIKSLWCDKERERESFRVSLCLVSLGGGASFNSSLSSVESFRVPSASPPSFSEESLSLLSSPSLYYFVSSRSSSLLSCFYSFLSGASPCLPLATHQFLSILLSNASIPPRLPAPLLLRPPRLRRAAAGRAERGSLTPRLQPPRPTRLPAPSPPPGPLFPPRGPLSSGSRLPPLCLLLAFPEGGGRDTARPGACYCQYTAEREPKDGGTSGRRACWGAAARKRGRTTRVGGGPHLRPGPARRPCPRALLPPPAAASPHPLLSFPLPSDLPEVIMVDRPLRTAALVISSPSPPPAPAQGASCRPGGVAAAFRVAGARGGRGLSLVAPRSVPSGRPEPAGDAWEARVRLVGHRAGRRLR